MTTALRDERWTYKPVDATDTDLKATDCYVEFDVAGGTHFAFANCIVKMDYDDAVDPKSRYVQRAELIKRAPQMLDALLRIVEHCDRTDPWDVAQMPESTLDSFREIAREALR